MKLKPGVEIDHCRAEILRAIALIEHFICEVTITSGTEDYEHSAERSRHYAGDAVDIRSRDFPDPEAVAKQIRKLLGEKYVVIVEKTHIHIHYAPNYATRVGSIANRAYWSDQ